MKSSKDSGLTEEPAFQAPVAFATSAVFFSIAAMHKEIDL